MVAFSWPNHKDGMATGRSSDDHLSTVDEPDVSPSEAEEILQGLAGVFSRPHNPGRARRVVYPQERPDHGWSKDKDNDAQLPNLEARYRALVEQTPAVMDPSSPYRQYDGAISSPTLS
jgi:hypothetical protein